jgi:hypothetical protein
VLVLPKTLSVVTRKCQCRFYYSSLLRTFNCIGILNSDADISETAINKAFEVEILQNKIKPCIVENLCIIALVGENMKIIKG